MDEIIVIDYLYTPCAVPNTYHILSHWILKQGRETLLIFPLTDEGCNRNVKWHAWGYTVNRWKSWDTKHGLLVSKMVSLSIFWWSFHFWERQANHSHLSSSGIENTIGLCTFYLKKQNKMLDQPLLSTDSNYLGLNENHLDKNLIMELLLPIFIMWPMVYLLSG